MRFGTLATAGLVALGFGASAHAATLFLSLQTVANPAGSNQFDVKIFARSDAPESAAGAGDGGVSGFQFDILSDGDSKSAPVPLAATGPNFAKVKTEFAVAPADFATQLVPQKKDVGVAELYPLDLDTDLDAYAGSSPTPTAVSRTPRSARVRVAWAP